LIWEHSAGLKAYCRDPTPQAQARLEAHFDRIFRRSTGFATLDKALARIQANTHALLVVLDRPDVPCHTNGSENDIRCQVARRKISGDTPTAKTGDGRQTPSSASTRHAASSASPAGKTSRTDWRTGWRADWRTG
jgi:hypothetical protein